MSVSFMIAASYIAYLYINGKLPSGCASAAAELARAQKCPEPECDCAMLRGRIRYLDRKLHDTENALLKAEGIYENLYKKYDAAVAQTDAMVQAKTASETAVASLESSVSVLNADLAVARTAYDQLASQCIERDVIATACAPGLSNTMLR